jgi:hypothetical protein
MSQIARLLASCGLVVAVASGVQAETVKKPEKDAANKPALVASYGDWSVFQSQAGKSHICYTLAQPKERAPADLKRDPAYAFISERPGERVRNEVSFIMGFEVGAARRLPIRKTRKRPTRRTGNRRATRSLRPRSSAMRSSSSFPRATTSG